MIEAGKSVVRAQSYVSKTRQGSRYMYRVPRESPILSILTFYFSTQVSSFNLDVHADMSLYILLCTYYVPSTTFGL